ncbi:MerR family transcriptional regulator [Pontixanthobacter aestiaquae]|uniref:MerR family transcriptional regulator n=1 Tax=Pontixanthobacter aestiaquae TaxID=1509367 RepID=A0A844Z820_9SPHN|nr:MerR family transcriptional regulator [Pontixanthobacter aestiaquae]MDN3644944.1 MerR family transcriptional regulator [Pontixanthobacter aestiaquae]MXO84055.1 MerR family transcriptional regulator [Pontixanthobacter aestiaquae]
MSAQFDDGKDDGALRTIGEVSKALNIKTHVLRYWEQQFPMLEPLKRSGGRRYYRPEDVELVGQIDRLVNQQGYTLKGAQQAIADGKTGEAPVPAPESEPDTEATAPASSLSGNAAVPADVIAQLKGIRARLAAALEA